MRKYTQLILDLDGTVYLSGVPIGPIIEQLNRFMAIGGQLRILTNNTSVSKVTYQKKLGLLGLNLSLSQIVSPVDVAGPFLRKTWGEHPRGFVLGTDDLKYALEEYAIQHTTDDAEFILVGFDKSVTYTKLQIACHLINKGIPYYITNIDLACPTQEGPIPDTGVLAKLLELVTGVKPLAHFGKPGLLMAEYLLSLVGNVEQTLLAGDRLYTDIVLGNAMGIDTVVVFSGETRPQDLINSDIQPTYTTPTLAEFLECQFTLK